jgi:hypothetical protein
MTDRAKLARYLRSGVHVLVAAAGLGAPIPEAWAEECDSDATRPGGEATGCREEMSYAEQRRQQREWEEKGVESIEEISLALCRSDHSPEDLRKLLTRFGLPAVSRLLRVRIPAGQVCRATPAPAIAAILLEAQRNRSETVRELDLVLRALRSRNRADVYRALYVLEQLSDTRWHTRDDPDDGRKPDLEGPASWEEQARQMAEEKKAAARDQLWQAATKPLTDLVRTTQGSLRVDVLRVIGASPSHFTHLVPDLVALLDYASARPVALAVLRRMGPEGAGAVAELRCRLRRTRTEGLVRGYADTLSFMGPAARSALPEIWTRLRQARMLRPKERFFRVAWTARAILRLDPDLTASSKYGGGPVLASALEEAVRHDWRRPHATAQMIWKLLLKMPRPLRTASLNAIMLDQNAPLDARM